MPIITYFTNLSAYFIQYHHHPFNHYFNTMTLAGKCDSHFTNRTHHRSLDARSGNIPNPSRTLLTYNRLNQSICYDAFEHKISQTSVRHNTQRFQELRRRLASRANERSKRVSIRTTTTQLFQPEECPQTTLQISPNSLSCSKAVVYSDQKAQQLLWKKTLKLVGQEEFKKTLGRQENSTISFSRPSRRFNQEIRECVAEKIMFGKNLRVKTSRRMNDSETVFYSKPSQENRGHRVNLSVSKASCRKSSQTKETKCSQNEWNLERIDPWSTNVIEIQELGF